jgi:hypothetical protein
MITKTKALVKNSKATRGKGRDDLLMSEWLLIGAYTNPQDATWDQSLDVTHDEYCSTEHIMYTIYWYQASRTWAATKVPYTGYENSTEYLSRKMQVFKDDTYFSR